MKYIMLVAGGLFGAFCGTLGGYLMFIYPRKVRNSPEPLAKDTFGYMESVSAGSRSPWHIRLIPAEETPKFGGGVTTPSLCGRVTKGWDLKVPLSEKHDQHICKECLAAYLRTGDR